MVSIAEIATIRETGALQNGHGTARDARQVWDRLHQRRESHPAEFTPKRHSGTAGFTYDSDGLHSFARNRPRLRHVGQVHAEDRHLSHRAGRAAEHRPPGAGRYLVGRGGLGARGCRLGDGYRARSRDRRAHAGRG